MRWHLLTRLRLFPVARSGNGGRRTAAGTTSSRWIRLDRRRTACRRRANRHREPPFRRSRLDPLLNSYCNGQGRLVARQRFGPLTSRKFEAFCPRCLESGLATEVSLILLEYVSPYLLRDGRGEVSRRSRSGQSQRPRPASISSSPLALGSTRPQRYAAQGASAHSAIPQKARRPWPPWRGPSEQAKANTSRADRRT